LDNSFEYQDTGLHPIGEPLDLSMYIQQVDKDRQTSEGEPNTGVWSLLGNLEEVYGYSDRSLWKHAKEGGIIGINYDHGAWSFPSDKPGLQGPVPSSPQKYILPKGTQGLYPGFVSGSVSSEIFIKSMSVTSSHTTAELFAPLYGTPCRLRWLPPT